MRNGRHTLVLGLSVLLSLLAACSKKQPTPAHKPIPVTVSVAQPVSTDGGREYVGTVEEESGVMLSFESGGSVSRILVDAGQRVSRGQALACLDPATLKGVYDAAAATLRQARDAYARYGNLYRQGTVPEVQWVEIESKLRQAEAAESVARKQLGNAVVRAPFSGVIADRLVEPGMNVAPGQPVLKLVKIGRVKVAMSVPENDIAGMKAGRKVVFEVAALGGRRYEAAVTEKGVVADPVSHTYTVKAELSNADGSLLPGMVCKVSMPLDGGRAIVLPPQVVRLADDGGRFVWAVRRGRATMRRVRIAGQTDAGIIVAQGVAGGDSVIVDGAQKVSEGMRVSLR